MTPGRQRYKGIVAFELLRALQVGSSGGGTPFLTASTDNRALSYSRCHQHPGWCLPAPGTKGFLSVTELCPCSFFCSMSLSCGRERAAQYSLHFEQWYLLIAQLHLPSSCWLRGHLFLSHMSPSDAFPPRLNLFFPWEWFLGDLVLACFSL